MSASKPLISIVVAIAQNNVIGFEGDMPWRLSTDLKRFKQITMDKPIIMGRKTFQSIGRPLPGRQNIVISRSDFVHEGVHSTKSVEEAILIASDWTRENRAQEICVIGGGEIYKLALPKCDRLYVTHVFGEPEGDTVFPKIDETKWSITSRKAFSAGEKDSVDTLYVIYDRIGT